MTNWKTTLNIRDLHHRHQEGEITIQEVAAGVAERFKRNKYAQEWQAQDIIDQLEGIAEGDDATAQDYDYVLRELYDFADTDHRIWVKTTV
jgi:hypothetical protein